VCRKSLPIEPKGTLSAFSTRVLYDPTPTGDSKFQNQKYETNKLNSPVTSAQQPPPTNVPKTRCIHARPVPHTHTRHQPRSSSGFAGVDHQEPKKTLFERTETTEASTTLITHDRSNGPRLSSSSCSSQLPPSDCRRRRRHNLMVIASAPMRLQTLPAVWPITSNT
jgi:hypothetical protein